MVAAPETVVADAPTSTAVEETPAVDWQSFDDEKKIEFANTKYEEARKCYAKNDITQACEEISTCLEIRSAVYGEKSKELFEPLILNARILLEQGRLEAGVISTAVQGLEDVPVEDDEGSSDEKKDDKIEGEALSEEQQEEVAEKVEAALEENAERIENKQPLPTEEEAAKDEEQKPEEPESTEAQENAENEGEDEGADEADEKEGEQNDEQNQTDVDDLTSYQLAYENAATARLIAENVLQQAAADSDEMKQWAPRVCESLLVLGEISIADENYESAIDDLTTAESKQRAVFAADDRRIAETYFQMGRCYSLWDKYDKAADVYKKSLEVITLLKDNTAAKLDAATADDDKTKLAEDVNKFTELIADIESWVKDSVESHVNKQQFDEQKAKESQENRPIETTAAEDNAATTEIQVRKRKPDESVEEKKDDAVDDIAVKKAKVAQEAAAPDAEKATV